MQYDVSDEGSVIEMLRRAREGSNGEGIRGIIHCAGVLRDAMIRGGGAAAGSDEVWRSKAHSAWLLHKHSIQDKDTLDMFVMYSSIAASLGNVGQGAYGAANGFLDALVEYLVGLGMSGLSIQWPAISGVGMAADISYSSNVDEYISVKALERVLLESAFCSNHRNDKDVNISTSIVSVFPVKCLMKSHRRLQSQFSTVSSYSLMKASKKKEVSSNTTNVDTRQKQKQFSKSNVMERIPKHVSTLINGNTMGTN